MPSAGGARLVVEGREEVDEVKESARVVRRAGNVAGAAMLDLLESRWIFLDNVFDLRGLFRKAIFPGSTVPL